MAGLPEYEEAPQGAPAPEITAPQQTGAPAPEAAAPAEKINDPQILDWMKRAQGHSAAPAPSAPPSVRGPASRPVPGNQSRFRSAALTPGDTKNYADMPWSEVGKQALHNALPSVGGVISSTAHALAPWNWGEDANAVSKLASGAKSKVMGWTGANQDPAQKQRDESVLNALFDHYGSTYGSEAGFKKTLATDPASVAMDASTLAGGAGAAAKIGGFGKIASGLSKVSRAVDPIATAVNTAKAVTYPAVRAARYIQSKTTGVPHDALMTAAKAGASADPELRSAFWRHYTGSAAPDEPLQATSTALDTLRKNTLAELQANKAVQYANNPGAMPFHKIDAAIASARANLNAAGAPASWKSDKLSALQDAEDWVNYHKSDPSLQTMSHFDDLRKEIGDLGWEGNNTRVKTTVAPIYSAIRETMHDVSPEYTQTLENISDAQRKFKDMARSLGTAAFDKGSAMTPTLIARQLRQMNTAGGRDMLSRVSQIDNRIPYMLAGAATHEFSPHGLRRFAEGVGAAGGIGAVAANPHVWPAVVGSGIAGLAAVSPKIAGGMHYGYGAAGRLAASPALKAGYYGGRADDFAAQPDQPYGASAALNNSDFDNMKLPRNARNHNYGNIKKGQFAKSQPGYAGDDGTFARFDSPESGAAATKALISHYLRTGRDTPNKLAADWLKGSENTDEDRAMYGSRIANKLGLNGDSKINQNDPAVIDKIFHQVARNEGSDVPEKENPAPRARGGRTTINHASEAAGLIRKAETAKKTLGKASEPLLNMPDDHIAKALSVANEAI